MTSSFSKAALPARTSSPSEEYRGGVPPNSKGGVGERFKEAITSLEMKIAITFQFHINSCSPGDRKTLLLILGEMVGDSTHRAVHSCT